MILQIIGAMQIFDRRIYDGGGPAGWRNRNIVRFKTAYTGQEFDAMSILVCLFVVLIILSYIQLRMKED